MGDSPPATLSAEHDRDCASARVLQERHTQIYRRVTADSRRGRSGRQPGLDHEVRGERQEFDTCPLTSTTYADLQARHDQARASLDRVTATITDRKDRLAQAQAIHEYLATQPPLEYSDDAWNLLVDHATVNRDAATIVVFKDERFASRAFKSVTADS